MKLCPVKYGAGGDPYYASVITLLHLEGANLSNTITDQKAILSAYSGATSSIDLIRTADYKFGTSSAYIYNGGGNNIGVATATNWNASSDYTQEMWFKWDADYPALDVGFMSNTLFDLNVRREPTTGLYQIEQPSGPTYTTSATAMTSGAWTHIALVRNGTAARLFINGVKVVELTGLTYTAFTASSTDISWDTRWAGGFGMTGYVDECRLTRGVARYWADFSPPTEAFPNS